MYDCRHCPYEDDCDYVYCRGAEDDADEAT